LVIVLHKPVTALSSPVEYRKGTLDDLATMKFKDGLSASGTSLEFNVLGVGHEFWIAVQGDVIIGVTVLAREAADRFRILHLEVAPARKKEGIGSALIRVVMQSYPQCIFSVIPFEGTEEFYVHLGFVRVGRWEMKYDASGRERL
jgi:GNAT superfamily N-acetyltransferase